MSTYRRVYRAWQLFMMAMAVVLLTACGGGGGGGGVANSTPQDSIPTATDSNTPTLTAIQVAPAEESIPKGLTVQFKATGVYSDGTSHDITPFVTWTSDTTTVATVDSAGLASAIAGGTAKITASQEDKSGEATLTVTEDTLTAIAVTPNSPTIPSGLKEQFTATGTYTNGQSYDITSDVSWASSDTAIASVDDAGMVLTSAVGSSDISASLDGVTGQTTLTVSAATLEKMTISPNNPTIPSGQFQQFTVSGIYSDGTTQDITSSVVLSAGDTSVAYYAYYTNAFRGIHGGSTAITATLGSVSVYTTLTVSPATLQSIKIYPDNPTLYSGTDTHLGAFGIYSDGSSENLTSQVTWSVDDTSIVTVDSDGLASPIATSGSTNVTATYDGLSATTTLTVAVATLQSILVTPGYTSISLGLTQQMTATGTYTDGTTKDLTSEVAWSSSYTSVATINKDGLVSTVSRGYTSITAIMGSISSYSTSFYVNSASIQSIAVTPADSSIPKGLKQQFTATGNYSDGTTDDVTSLVTWNSDDTAIATVAKGGKVSAVDLGSATITATYGSISGSTTVTVGAVALHKIRLTPSSPMIANSAQQQFAAVGIYSDGSTQDISTDVTWSSASSSVAGISDTGLATSVGSGLGSSVITATLGAVTGSTILTTSDLVATPNAVAFQGDTGHSGQMTWGHSLSFPSSSVWQVDLGSGGVIGTPLIVNGRVYVLAKAAELQLVALDVASGNVLWGPIALSASSPMWGGLAYDNGKLFVLNPKGQLSSYDAVTGKAGWSVTLTSSYSTYSAPPVAKNGTIYVESYNKLAAVDEDDGSELWSYDRYFYSSNSPSVSDSAVFVSTSCETDAYDPQTGASIWNQPYGCSGGSGHTLALGSGNTLFELNSYYVNHVLNALTGDVIGTFPGTVSPVAGSTYAYVMASKTLQSMTVSDNTINWDFTGDGNLNTPAIAVDDTLFVGSSSGNVYAVDAATGSQLWTASAGSVVGDGGANTGLAAADGYLVVPADKGLTAWKILP